MSGKFTFKVLVLLFLACPLSGNVFSQAENTDELITDFKGMVSSFRKVLEQLAVDVSKYKEWFKSYQSEALLANGGVLDDTPEQQLAKIWAQIEKLEQQTTGGWLDVLASQLDSDSLAQLPSNEIQSLMASQRLYVSQIQANVAELKSSIEHIKQAYALPERVEVAQTSEVSFDYLGREYDVLETSLIYLLAGLETWGSWLDPTSEMGLFPEAEGRFIVSSTPILQTGATSNGMGVIGFAQPVIISHSSMPQGFTADQQIFEQPSIEYDESIEDVFAKISYADRLSYQYGVQIDGRKIQIYRKPVDTELTLSNALQRMGAPPETTEAWLAEYAEVAHLPQTVQLSWLIAGNPLARDYKLHIENTLKTFNINTLLSVQGEEYSVPQAPEAKWVSQDPFWAELQNQPFLKAFSDLLSGTSEEIQRSFIITLFFLEPTPSTFQARTKINSNNVGLRSKPFFWSEESTIVDTTNDPAVPIEPARSVVIDPDQSLVEEALKQRKNLIKYWLPGQGYRTIPWSQRGLLNPYEQGAPYFVMGVTALPQFAPQSTRGKPNNYSMIVLDIANKRLPQNQPVFKVFAGPNVEDRHIIDSSGKRIRLAGDTFLWRSEKLDNDAIMQYGIKHTSTRKYPYVAAHFDSLSGSEGPYIAGSLPQLKKLLAGKQDYLVDMAVVKYRGTAHYGNTKVKMRERFSPSNTPRTTWLSENKQLATDIFSWSSQKQDRLLVRSLDRQVIFEKANDADVQIQVASMIKWENLPANEKLLQEGEKWGTSLFLMQVRQGYFILPAHELEYLQLKADERPQVHTFLPLVNSDTEVIIRNTKDILTRSNLDCESVRMLSKSGMELAYSSSCKIIATESGWELAKSSQQVQLAAAKLDEQPIAVFHSENKPPSALPLRFFLDVEQSSIEDLQVSTLVPAYNLEDLDSVDKEDAIEVAISDALARVSKFFPKQQAFEVLMPKSEGTAEQRLTYTNLAPKNFEAKYSYDTITISTPVASQKVTFYSLRESALTTESSVGKSTRASELEIASKDVLLPSGELNKDKILLLARAFHDTNESPYLIVQGNQGKFYAGSLSKLKNSLSESAEPANLLALVTKSAGYSIDSLGWLEAVSKGGSELSQALQVNLNHKSSRITAWSSNGERQAIFTADGTLQLDELLQWPKRPDNQTLKSMRQVVNRHILLVNIPNKGYFIAQSSDGEFLVRQYQAQIDTLILSFGQVRNLTMIKNRAIDVIRMLPIDYSVRVLGSIDLPIIDLKEGNKNSSSFYDDIDIALKISGKEDLLVDLQKSGLELARREPRQWIIFADRFSSPLAIFQWSDGRRSSILFEHLLDVMQDVNTLEAQLIVPAYSLEELDEDGLDKEEIGEYLATTLQDTLQRTLTFLPSQTTFQIVMPEGETVRYSQNAPPKRQIKRGPLGVIEVTRAYDGAKIKYYQAP